MLMQSTLKKLIEILFLQDVYISVQKLLEALKGNKLS